MCKVFVDAHTTVNTMDERRKRLTRSLYAPRRCNTCHKMVYFTAVRCKQCGNISHETCANSPNHWCNINNPNTRRNSHQTVTGDTNWSQFSSERISEPLELNQEKMPEDCSKKSGGAASSAATALSGLLKVVHWLSQRKRSREMSKANAADKHVKGRFGLNQDKIDDKMAKKRLKTLLKNVQRFQPPNQCSCNWPHVGPVCLVHNDSYQNFFTSPSGSLSSSGCVSTASSAAQTPSDTEGDFGRLTSSICRTQERLLQLPEVCYRAVPSVSSPSSNVSASQTRKGTVMKTRAQNLSMHGRFGRHWMTKAKTLSLETKGSPIERLCATWPPVGKTVSTVEDFLDDTESGIGDCDLSEISAKSQCADVRETLGEWCIPFGDLDIIEKLKQDHNGDIYRGRWHGEVLIYTFKQETEEEVGQFLEEVAQLSMIRHENVVLFMGACIEPPQLAIITSMRKGPSLYEQLHMQRYRLPFYNKVSIARQIAQGMGYLHAKGIIHKKLNSKNIILEGRVKLCIMDQAMTSQENDRPGYGSISRGHLTYISPELMRTLRVDPPHVYPEASFTRESDIYAFGSVLYELLSEKFAFSSFPSHTVIWLIANGRTQMVDDLKCTNVLRGLLIDCWCATPQHRPPFSYIARQLQENVSLHKRHSSSEPERIHHTGRGISV